LTGTGLAEVFATLCENCFGSLSIVTAEVILAGSVRKPCSYRPIYFVVYNDRKANVGRSAVNAI